MALTPALVAQVRRAARVGDASASDVADADVLAQADMEVEGRFVPSLVGLREDFFTRRVDAVLYGGGRVRLPARALYGGVRLVQAVREGGYAPQLPRLQLGEGTAWMDVSHGPRGYTMDGAGLRVHGQPDGGVVRVWYGSAPGKLVMPSACDAVATVTTAPPALHTPSTAAVVTRLTSNVPSAISTADIISVDSAHHMVASGLAVSGSSPVTLTGTWDDVVQPGDYICRAGETCVVPLPEECFASLADAVAARILEGKGYFSEADAVRGRAEAGFRRALEVLTPRAVASPLKVRGGMLQRLRGWR